MLDLFAGSGALGIEALSRGAAWADFVERDRRQCQVIRSNLEVTGFSPIARVHCSDVNKCLYTLDGGYSVMLLDPPYAIKGLDRPSGEYGWEPQTAEGRRHGGGWAFEVL